MFNLISIQLNSQSTVSSNLDKIEQLVSSACQQSKRSSSNSPLVVLPECATLFGVNSYDMLDAAELYQHGLIQTRFSQIASANACYLVAGTTPIRFNTAEKDPRYHATSLVFDPSGHNIAHYNKIHLFDVEVSDNTKSYKESKTTIAGEHLSLFEVDGAEIAQAVCYDLRFADMFCAYSNYTKDKQAPKVVVLPSAFTKVTGKAHWHALLKARSIENQCFVVASNQVGQHADNRETFGNSCIYSPWGACLDLVEDKVGFAIATYNPKEIDVIRTKMPISTHKKVRYKLEC